MAPNEKFVAQILETSAGGFAGLATSLLLERRPEIEERYAPDAFAGWKEQLQRWLLDLSAAIDAGEPKLFEAQARRTRESFAARRVPPEDLQAALTALHEILGQRLPADAAETATRVVQQALDALSAPAADEAEESVAPAALPQKASLTYLDRILAGHPRLAIDRLLETATDEASVRSAYLDVLIPAQRETGRLWHAGELTIAEEHVITTTTQRAMALLCERARTDASNGKTVVLACVAGNVHDLGIRAISDFYEIAGWRAVSLGPDVPGEEVARTVSFFDADVVVLAAALDPHVKAVRKAIEQVRDVDDGRAKIIIGGSAFAKVPELWKKLGADGYAARLEDAEPLGSRLTG